MGLLCWERSRRGSLLLRPGQKEGWRCLDVVSYRNLALALWLLFSHCLDFGISDCGFCTPIVRSNCPLKSIQSAKFYENGFSPALPFMITLWPHDIRLCCINFNTNNCWLRTEKKTSKCKEKSNSCNPQEIRISCWVEGMFCKYFTCPLKYLRHISYSFCLRLSVYARLVSVLWLVFAAPPIKVTTGQ